MKINVRGTETFVSTGGRAFDAALPTAIFIHGSGQNHLSYLLQGRFLANRGFSVLNPDLPAHGLSLGDALTSIEDMADWIAELASETGVKKAAIIGHSQGGLVALELGRRHPELCEKIVFIATAAAIPVNPALLDMAENKESGAIASMVLWGNGERGHFDDHTMPGQTHMNFGNALMAANENGALFADLSACAAYSDGMTAAATIQCPTLTILAEKDMMTPIKFGRKLASALPNNTLQEVANAGHMLPSENPDSVTFPIRDFIK